MLTITISGIKYLVLRAIKYTKYKIQNTKYSSVGFTLIELMIVLTLLGLAIGFVTTSYLGFERRERVKNGALALKNHIRYAQSRAHTGYKGFEASNKCDTNVGQILVGWYVTISVSSSSYKIAGDCISSGSEQKFGEETFNLPKDVRIIGVSGGSDVSILYRPLTEDATFHNFSAIPDFLDGAGNIQNELGPAEVVVTLKGSAAQVYEVRILASGEVNEKKI